MKLSALLLFCLTLNISIAQTIEYETGQNSSDA